MLKIPCSNHYAEYLTWTGPCLIQSWHGMGGLQIMSIHYSYLHLQEECVGSTDRYIWKTTGLTYLPVLLP